MGLPMPVMTGALLEGRVGLLCRVPGAHLLQVQRLQARADFLADGEGMRKWRGVELGEREIWARPFVCIDPLSLGFC